MLLQVPSWRAEHLIDLKENTQILHEKKKERSGEERGKERKSLDLVMTVAFDEAINGHRIIPTPLHDCRTEPKDDPVHILATP